MIQAQRINIHPRFAGFPCQTLSEGGTAQRSKPISGHIQGTERKTGLTEPICNASGGITHPCCHDPHTAAINGPNISHRRLCPGTAKAGLERNQRGRRLAHDTSGPINGGVNVVLVPGSLLMGGRNGLRFCV